MCTWKLGNLDVKKKPNGHGLTPVPSTLQVLLVEYSSTTILVVRLLVQSIASYPEMSDSQQ